MTRFRTVEAIVLRTYDVGEADRYCILLTRECGRLPARANGVRKPKSRMGGCLLPFQRVTAELTESSAGWLVTGATHRGGSATGIDAGSFAAAARGFEVLLRLIQDDEPLPEVFDATLTFLRGCELGMPHMATAYTLRLLHLLGFLPAEDNLEALFTLEPGERTFLQATREGVFLRDPPEVSIDRLERVCDRFLQDQLSGPLRAPGVAAAMERGA